MTTFTDDNRLRGDIYTALAVRLRGAAFTFNRQATFFAIRHRDGHELLVEVKSGRALAVARMSFVSGDDDQPNVFIIQRLSPTEDALTMPGVPLGTATEIADNLATTFLNEVKQANR